MKSVSSTVVQWVLKRPYLVELMDEGLINVRALADKMKPDLESELGSEVKLAAVQMALKRMKKSEVGLGQRLYETLRDLGALTVWSEVSVLTFKNSPTLADAQTRFFNQLKEQENLFYIFNLGLHESNIITETRYLSNISLELKMETYRRTDDLSAISVKLPEHSHEVTGLYYQILKELSWNGVNLFEIFSTAKELGFIIEKEVMNEAFSVLNKLGTSGL